MSKRKAGVNDIIYELDNEDIEASSDDEVKEPKINRLETTDSTNPSQDGTKTEETCFKNNDIDKSCEEVINIPSPTIQQNGGKTSDDLTNSEIQNGTVSQRNVDQVDCVKKTSTDCCKTTILNEDIVIDSPGNSDLGVEGCENRTPLVTVRFRDKRLASNYKEQIKAFMLNLIKIHEGDSLVSGNETDLELDIWPEDLNEEPVEEKIENNLFFVDTDPGDDKDTDIPRYSQTSTVISNTPEKESTPPPIRRGPTCFNCDGDHPLRDCLQPRDFVRIANKRKSLPVRVGRYHVEDEQKFGHLIPGRISGQLRHALGLKRHEIPLHIYRMRVLGYPPGWLEEARISHSGISMFDSLGNAILDPEEEEGEVCEPGSKDKFDIKKILDFPGFNVPVSPRYKEEAHTFGLPPMSDQDSKLSMLQFLAPNAMKAYKRKKLTMFPSAGSNNTTLEGQAEMELDSGDEVAAFPSVPPLPDEAPPPLLPPPPPPPTCPPPLPPTCPPPLPPTCPPPLPPTCPPSPLTPPQDKNKPQPKDEDKSSGDDIEVIEVLKIGDIPVPMSDFIVIDEDDSEVEKSQSSDRGSPTLDDLEAKKQLLLDALDVTGDSILTHDVTISDTMETEEDRLNKTSDSIIEIMDVTCEEVKECTGEQKSIEVDLSSNDDNSKNVANNDENSGNLVNSDANGDNVVKNEQNDRNVANSDANGDKVVNDDASVENAADVTANNENTADVSVNVVETDRNESTSETPTEGSQYTTDKASESNSQESISIVQCTDTQVSASSSQQIDTQESISIVQCTDTQVSASSSQQIYTQESVSSSQNMNDSQTSTSAPKTPDNRTGHVKVTEYGTPVMNIASSYVKLPTDDKFAKDICDVINFENLPNSTGKYKQISALLRKVKSEVDRIQDS